METLQNLLKIKAEKAIKKAFSSLVKDIAAEVVACNQENFGHYQCNDALKLAKILKKNPRDVANDIINNFDMIFLFNY